jgi:hypothetical protein
MARLIPFGRPVRRWHEARVSEPEAVELGFFHLAELPSSERTRGVPTPEYLLQQFTRFAVMPAGFRCFDRQCNGAIRLAIREVQLGQRPRSLGIGP